MNKRDFIRSIIVTALSCSIMGFSVISSHEDDSRDLRQLTVKLPNYAAQERTVEIKDGLVLLEGDMILGTEEEVFNQRGAYILGENFRWNLGIIPYVIDGNHPATTEILAAIKEMNGHTFICLQDRTVESDYVRFRSGNTNASAIGRQGGEQAIFIRSDAKHGDVMHEILHALGMLHEHTRPDRDEFIQINYNNIDERDHHNFDPYLPEVGASFGVYDYSSIMHFDSMAFARMEDLITIEVRNQPPPPGEKILIGFRNAISSGDAMTLNFLYPKAHGCCDQFAGYNLITREQNGTEVRLRRFRDNTFHNSCGEPILSGNWNFVEYYPYDFSGDGNTDIMARTSKGEMVLFSYRNGKFENSSGDLVGSGFNYKEYLPGYWSQTGSGSADMMVLDHNNQLLHIEYIHHLGRFTEPKVVGTSFEFTDALVGNWIPNGSDDLIIRTSDGSLLLYAYFNGVFTGQKQPVGVHFNFDDHFVEDFDGDGLSELMGRLYNGDIYYYDFIANAFPPAFTGGQSPVAKNWHYKEYYLGHWSGNQSADILVQTDNGVLELYPFFNGQFVPKYQVGQGFTFEDGLVTREAF